MLVIQHFPTFVNFFFAGEEKTEQHATRVKKSEALAI